MKTFSTLATLVLILSVCAASAILYLQFEYNFSALLTIVWIVSMTVWIKSNGFFAKEDRSVNQAAA